MCLYLATNLQICVLIIIYAVLVPNYVLIRTLFFVAVEEKV